MKRIAFNVLGSVSLVALAACGDVGDGPPPAEMIEAPVTTAAAPSAASAAQDAAGSPSESAGSNDAEPRGEIAASPAGRSDLELILPKMAYALSYGFRLPGEAIGGLQQTHADMCEAQGPYVCQIVSLSRTGEESDEIRGTLQLAVASDRARAFATRLTETAAGAGAEAVRAEITGEDLSKSIVDIEAQLRTRIALRDRLMEVLRTRRGPVQELVEAERRVAEANTQIDQAQSWLKEQKGRVAYSRLTLSYEAANPGGAFLDPIKAAAGSVGAILGMIIAALIVGGAIALPLLLAVLGIRRLGRRINGTAA